MRENEAPARRRRLPTGARVFAETAVVLVVVGLAAGWFSSSKKPNAASSSSGATRGSTTTKKPTGSTGPRPDATCVLSAVVASAPTPPPDNVGDWGLWTIRKIVTGGFIVESNAVVALNGVPSTNACLDLVAQNIKPGTEVSVSPRVEHNISEHPDLETLYSTAGPPILAAQNAKAAPRIAGDAPWVVEKFPNGNVLKASNDAVMLSGGSTFTGVGHILVTLQREITIHVTFTESPCSDLSENSPIWLSGSAVAGNETVNLTADQAQSGTAAAIGAPCR